MCFCTRVCFSHFLPFSCLQVTSFVLIATIAIVVGIFVAKGRQNNANDDDQPDVDVEDIRVRISEAPKRGAGGGPETQTEPKPDLYSSGIEMQNLPN